MSDLPPAERPTPPRARRATRPKPRSAAARRANRPSSALNSAASTDELLTAQAKDSAIGAIGKTTPKGAANQDEPEVVEPAGDRVTIRVRGLTLLSKQILLWASIIGVINLALSIGTNFFISAFGSTKAQQAQNAGLLNGGFCLSS